MAKKTNDELYASFVADVLSMVPADQREGFERTLRSEPVTAKMKDSVLARADYSRTMDEARAELASARETFNGEVAEARTRISGWETWYTKASQEVAEAKSKSDAYEAKYGTLSTDHVDTSGKKSLSEDDFHKRLTEELEKHDQAAIAFANDLTKVQIDYLREFKDVLDTDQLIKDATSKRITLKAAYQEFVAPKLKEREQKRFEDEIAKAKEEGRREGQSGHRLPTFSGPVEPHVLDSINRTDLPRTDTDRVAAAVKGWGEIRNSSRST